MVLQSTNVLYVGEIGVGPQMITSLFFCVRALFEKNKIFDKNKLLKYGCAFGAFFCSMLCSILINKCFSETYLWIIQIFIYIITSIAFLCVSSKFKEDDINKMIDIVTCFVIVVGIVQFLITSNTIPRISIIKILLFNDDSISVYYNHDNYFRLCSTFMEPSYCACFLLGALAYYSCRYEASIKQLVIMSLIITAIFFTKSTTAYVGCAVLYFLFLIIKINPKMQKTLLFTVPVLITISLLFGEKLYETIVVEKLNSGSFTTRDGWNKLAKNQFLDNVVVGAGYKMVRGSSLFYSLLGQIGLLGMAAFSFFNSIIVIDGIKNRKSNLIAFSLTIILILVCQVVACPDIDFCVYWLGVYLFFSFFLCERKNGKEENAKCVKTEVDVL